MARGERPRGLTVKAVEAAKSIPDKPTMHADGKGLYLRVGPAGKSGAAGGKSWVYRYKVGAKRHDMGLGSYPDIGLAEARERAAAERRKLKVEHVDPLQDRRDGRAQARLDAAKAMSFEQCAAAYIDAHKPGWRNAKHGDQWAATLKTYVYPSFGTLPVQAVDVGLVMKAVEPIWAQKSETASRVRGRIESVLDWATARGYRQGENPARWRGHLENLLPARSKVRRVEHHAALPYTEIGAFMVELRRQEGLAARALEFAIFTAARTGEVIGAKWSEIDLAARLWTVPGERMKAGREHRVPLSDAALAILAALPRDGVRSSATDPGGVAATDRVFPLSNMAMLKLLARMKVDVTPHGFRSTFRDWAAERTSFPAEVAEMALAHVVADKVEAAYRRGDLFEKRRQLADAWAKFCAMPAAAGGKVVAIGAAR